MKRTFGLILLVLVFGCASGPSPEEMANADYGEYPANYENIIANYMEHSLKDPSGVQYKYMTKPTKQYYSFYGTGDFGYGVCVKINAKNSFGGYIGFNRYFFLIRNGEIAQHAQEDVTGTTGATNLMGNVLEKRCPE